MNKFKFVAILILIGVVGYFGFVYKPCEKPTVKIVGLAYLSCALSMTEKDLSNLRDKICVDLGRQQNCNFVEQDKSIVESAIDNYVKQCATLILKEKNYCTDKLPNLKDL